MTFGRLFRAEPEPIEDELNIERAHVGRKRAVREVPADEWDALLTGLALSDAYLRAYVESACVLDPGEPVRSTSPMEAATSSSPASSARSQTPLPAT